MFAHNPESFIPSFLAEIIPEKSPAVLIFVAVNAEILPVGAVRRIIQGIAVFMSTE